MKKQIVLLFVATALLSACGRNKAKEAQEKQAAAQVVPPPNADSLSSHFIIDESGNTLEIESNKLRGTLTATLDGKTIEMRQDPTAPGIRASNERYIYTELQGNVKLERDGIVVFEKSKEAPNKMVKDKTGNSMTVVFDTDQRTAVVNLNGAEMTLLEQPATPGIYRDGHNELRIEGDKMQLIRDGQPIFQSE